MKTENTTDFKEVNEDSNVLSKKSLLDNFNVIVPKEYNTLLKKINNKNRKHGLAMPQLVSSVFSKRKKM